jgi:transformation/transcription domain-associated protein
MELVEEITQKFVPENVLTNVRIFLPCPCPSSPPVQYMVRTLKDASSLWLMRKHFAMQTAASMFLSHVACLSNRTPGRFHMSLKTGLMYMSEVLPCKFPSPRGLESSLNSVLAFDAVTPMHRCNEKVPFRLSPNMQHFITPTGIEGILTSSVIAMARSLSMPEFDLESCLTLFLRDEVSCSVDRACFR